MGMKSFYIKIMMFKTLHLFHASSRRKSMFVIQPRNVTWLCVT